MNKNTIEKILIWVTSTFVIIFVLSLISFMMVRAFGKQDLYNNASTPAPALNLETKGENKDVVLYNDKEYQYNKDILTFLIIGVDSLEKLPDPAEIEDYTLGGQADTLFLLVINPHTKKAQVIAINRNSMAEVDVYDSENNYARTDMLQICLQHGYGSGLEDSCERQVSAVSRMFYDLPIHGYFAMNMAAVSILNDAAGGVKLEVLENVPWGTDVIAKGKGNTVTLEGMDAYYYLQYRDVDEFDSATMRLARQKQYLGAFANKVIDKTREDPTFPIGMISEIKDYSVTDINSARIAYLVTSYIGYDFNTNEIMNLKGETQIGGGGFEEFVVDDDALYDLIIDVFYEEVLEES